MSASNRVRPCGDDLISIDVADSEGAQALAANLRASGNWLEVVGGVNTVVLRFDSSVLDLATAMSKTADTLDFRKSRIRESARIVEIPVRYGGEYGPDIDAVCAELALCKEEFVALHTSGEYNVAMLGFTPGFAYIGGLDNRLNVPRLSEPRVKVAAGSVGIAGEHTGLYALPGPGGWSLIGRTDYPLFDASAEDAFALCPGMQVRFIAMEAG